MSEVAQVPQLRFPEFVGEWEDKTLGDVATITTGSTPSTSHNEYYDGDVAFVSPADIWENRFVNSTKTTITELGLSVVREIKKRSTLFVCIGSTIGKVSQAGVNCATNQQINALTAKKYFDNDFIYSLLESKAPRIKLLAGVQAVPQINKSEFSRFKFTFPLLLEQQKIAAFLIAVDNKIEQLSKKQELLKEYKKGLMQKIFAQEIRFKADDGSDFADWEEKRLGDTLKTVSTRPFQIKSANVLEAGAYRVVDQGKKRVAGYSNKRDKVYTDGEIIVYGDHTTIVKYIDFDFIIGADGTKLLTASKSNNLKYMYYNLLHNNIKPEGYKRHFSILKSILLQIPLLEEQTKIANFLSSIDNKIEQVGERLDKSKQFKKALLQQMFV